MARQCVGSGLGITTPGQRADPAVDLIIKHVAADLAGYIAFTRDRPVAVWEPLRLVVVYTPGGAYKAVDELPDVRILEPGVAPTWKQDR